MISLSSPYLFVECRLFIQSLLNVNVEERLDSFQMLQARWPTLDPVKRPIPIIAAPGAKYTIENCLPQNIHFPRTPVASMCAHNHMYGTGYPQLQIEGKQTLSIVQMPPPEAHHAHHQQQHHHPKTAKPLVAKIGACGRKIADAVKHRGHHHYQSQQQVLSSDRKGVPQRATT